MCWLDYPNLNVGDILYCLYPFNTALLLPASQPHYTIIVKIEESNQLPKRVELAYGTSKKTDKIYQSELLVSNDTAKFFNKTGLYKPTKFDFADRLILPYNCIYFLTKNGATPKVGHIDFSNDSKLKNQMHKVVSYLQSQGKI